jgi:hypothetical protein
VSRDGEAYMPAELVQRVLESASPDVVLIGGQALAFWMGYYSIHAPNNVSPAISRDVDFFTSDAANVEPLRRFARAIRGREEIQDQRALSALIGSAVAPAEEGRIYNVDLLHTVVGLKRESIEANEVIVSVPGTDATLQVMHPLDVLQSRNANLYTLAEKQDDAGRLQLRLAIDVAREYLGERIFEVVEDADLSDSERQRLILDEIGIVSDYSREDAATKNADRHGIHLADAIPTWRITSDLFWEKQWTYIRGRMSPEYADMCERRREDSHR